MMNPGDHICETIHDWFICGLGGVVVGGSLVVGIALALLAVAIVAVAYIAGRAHGSRER